MFDLDNASHTVIEQSNAATNPYFVNTSFPTGTKVSRGVPDFSHGYKSIPRGPRFQCYKL